MSQFLRVTARLLTGSTYVLLGADVARTPGAVVDQAATVLNAIRRVVPLPTDDEAIVRGNAVVQVVGGALLILGRFPRSSALALVGSMIPTTLAGHAYWMIEDPSARNLQRLQFYKNTAMIGGLLFGVLDQHR